MSEFDSEVALSITVERQELRRVRSDIEDHLSDIALGIDAPEGGRGAARADGGGGRERRRRRREFRWARQRTDDLEEVVEILDDIEDAIGEGGGGLLGSVLGGVGGALPQALATGVGAAVGTAVGDALSDESVAVDAPEGGIPVEDPGTIGVEDTDSIDVDAPEELPVEEPILEVDDVPPLAVEDVPALLVDDPSPLGVQDPSPLQVERPEWKVGVEQPDPIEVNVTATGRGGGGGSGPDSDPGRTIGEFVRDQIRRVPGGGMLAEADRRIDEHIGRVSPIGSPETAPRPFGGRGDMPPDRAQRGGRAGDGSSVGVQTVQVQHDTTVDVGSIDVDVDEDRIIDETVGAFEAELEAIESDFQRQIDQLERRIQREVSG